MKGTKKALLCLLGGIMSVSLATAVAISLPTNAQATTTDTIFFEDFESGLHGFAPSSSTNGSATTLATSVGYGGTQSMEAYYQYSRLKTLGGTWIQQGDFFEFSVWAKAKEKTATSTIQIVNWYAQQTGAYVSSYNIKVLPNTTVKTDDWVNLKGVFGVYSDGTKFYAYQNGGELGEIQDNAGYYVAQQAYLDLGVTGKSSIYYDDISIAKTTVAKDVTVTVLYGETEVSGATFVVYDSDGVALTTQPEVVEENGVYTLQGVPFDNFASKYTVKAYVDGALKGTGTVSYMESETTISSAIYYQDFENGLGGFAPSHNNGATTTLVAETADIDCAYTGTNALQSYYQYSRLTTLGGAWIQKGDFFQFSVWTKAVDASATATIKITNWYGSYNGSYTMTVIPNTTVKKSDGWVNLSGVFGVYSDGTKFYNYHNGGVLEEVAQAAGYSVHTQAYLDIGVTGKLNLYYDDIMITKTMITKDVTVSAFDGNTGLVLTGATLTILDEDGMALATQPTVTENGGVYTISGLSFGNFAQSYTVQVEKNGKTQTGVATYLNNSISITTPEDETELKISASNDRYAYQAGLVVNSGKNGFAVTFDTAKTFTTNENLGALEKVTFKAANGETQNVTATWLGNNKVFFAVGDNYVPALGDTIVFEKGFALKGKENLQETVSLTVVNVAENAQLAITPKVAASLTLDGKIGLNFKFALESGFAVADSEFQIVYKKGEDVLASETLAGKTADKNGRYVGTYSILPKDYQDRITAQLQNANGNVLLSVTYSIEEYAQAVENGNYSSEAKALTAKALAYCKAASAYFAGETVVKDETAVDGLAGYVGVGTGTIPNAIKGFSCSLLLEAGTELRVYIFANNLDGVTCTVNGVEQIPVKAANGKWYVTCEDIAANELETMVRFTFSDGENACTIEYSALCYANYVVNDANSSDALVNVVKAMYFYSEATKAYVQSLEG